MGNFNFHSTAYEVLVISGFRAQFAGTGRVNNVTGYSFRLTLHGLSTEMAHAFLMARKDARQADSAGATAGA